MDILADGVLLFGRYKTIKPLGKGGSGIVYLAEDIKVGNLVAIKVVSKLESDFDLLAEKDILKELRHSAIPIIMDIEEDEQQIYLVEEYIEGESLGVFKNKLLEDEVIDIMKQLCDVLQYLHISHDKPIIYQDLKPNNVIRMPNGRIKLIDFGIAKKYKKESKTEAVQYGTRGYAAPEQFGMSKTDVRTDIFSLGISIYYILTGKNLSTPPYKLKPIREENQGVSRGFEKIITKCIEIVPSKRYQSISALLYDLEHLNEKKGSSKDYETFLKKGEKVITCTGIKKGIGTTHIALLLAFYYKLKSKKVALIEWQNSDTFTKISHMYKDIKEQRHHFEWMNIDFYTYYNHKPYHELMDESYDVIIIDGGDFDGLSQKGYFQKSHEVLLVCGGKDWEIDLFEEYYFSQPSKNYHYCFNFVDDRNFNIIKEGMEGFKCHQIPYNPNPYNPSNRVQQMFGTIMSEEVEEVTKETRGILDEAKAYIRNKFKKKTE